METKSIPAFHRLTRSGTTHHVMTGTHKLLDRNEPISIAPLLLFLRPGSCNCDAAAAASLPLSLRCRTEC
jgi:hypothetical protein